MARILESGERFPDFVLPNDAGTPTHLYARVGGRPVLVILHRRVLENISNIAKPLKALIDVVSVSGVAQVVADHVIGFTDQDDEILTDHMGDEESTAYVLDSNLRVLRKLNVSEDLVDRVQEAISDANEDSGSAIRLQAPVLTVPRVLAPEHCGFLMDLWEKAGSVETGVEQSVAGGRGDVLSTEHKVRRDHTVEDPKLIRLLTQSIGRRVLNEIERAFVYRPTHFEGFKIACYEAASSGFFGAHRDNLSPSTAHRRLALSLNLNDEYEGGELRFPEFGNGRYKPGAGDGVVFSCGHLHEVLPVTSGRRFTLLTFLYDPSAERERAVDPFAV